MTPAAVARACLGVSADPPDADLLGRYADRRDPEALAARPLDRSGSGGDNPAVVAPPGDRGRGARSPLPC